MRPKIAGYVVLIASVLLLCSCSGGSDDAMVGDGTGSIAFSIALPEDTVREVSGAAAYYKASRAPWCEEYGIASVEAKVYDENNNLIASGGPWACALGEGIIKNVRAGNNRTVVIFLRDDNGDVRYQGEKSEIYVPAGGMTNAGVITVEIMPEDILTAADDNAEVNRGGVVVIPVLSNDYDPTGEGLSVTILTEPSYGDLSLNTDGSIRYIHTDTGSEATSDSFTYQITDNMENVSWATVTIAIIPAIIDNQDPVANGDYASATRGGAVSITVLENDYDPDGDELSVILTIGPVNGSVELSSDGSFVYRHNGTETASDSFEYGVNDGRGGIATAFVNITVLLEPADNHAPVLDQGTVSPDSGQEGDTFTYTVRYADEDGHAPSSIVVIIDGTSHEMEFMTDSGQTYNGTYTYETELFGGVPHNYVFSCSDGNGGVDDLSGEGPTVNRSPVAVVDSASVLQGGTVDIPVLDNDYDPDGDQLSVILEPGSGPENGEVVLGSDGIFVYTHDGTETANDGFTYEVNDGQGGSATAVVNITVLSGPDDNHAPVLDQGTVSPDSGQEGDTFTYTVRYADEDGHAPSSIVVIIDGTSHEMEFMTDSGQTYNGTYTYETELFGGVPHSYVFSCSDGNGGVDDLSGEGPTVNRNPVAVADSASVFKGGMVFIPVLDNDYDPDEDPLSINPELILAPANGEVVLLPGRGFVYTHKVDFNSDSFQYEVIDGRGGSATAEVSIAVGVPEPDENNPPVLTCGGVSPEAGSQGYTFTYTVHYTDADGDVPSFVVVFIDGKEYTMDPVSGSPENDGIYTFGLPLDEPLFAGVEHEYVFLCSDGNGGYAVLAGKGPRVVESAYYVAPPPFGDNGNNGTIDDPFATIAYAVAISMEPVVINIAAGEYQEENLTLDSGTILIGGWSDKFSTRWDFINNGITPNIQYETVIDGNQSGRCIIEVSVQDVFISGVTLTDGNAGAYEKGGSALYIGSCSPSIAFCNIIDNTTTSNNDIYGGAVYIDDGSPVISRCVFSGNSAEGPHIKKGGAIYSNNSSPVIEKCEFTNNHAGCNMGAGGAIYNLESHARITDCIFSGNSTGGCSSYGGAIYNERSDPVIVNCIFDRNTASGIYISCGGAVYNDSSSPVITNCSFSLNEAANPDWISMGNSIYIDSESSPIITNTIMWGESANSGNEIYLEEGSMAEIVYCDIDQNLQDLPESATVFDNIRIDPSFVDPANGDLHLDEDSDCINEGTNDAPSLPETDFEGDLRDIQVDIGADEYVF